MTVKLNKDEKSEIRFYKKIMGIEEARKHFLPMPPSVKIPKSSRLHSSNGRCNVCGHEALEGREDGHGIWHYKCIYCVTHQKPDPNPCPRCRCTSHEKLCNTSEMKNPFEPDVILFRCLNCGFEWNTPEFETYLLTKAVKSILPTSEFTENRKRE